MIALLSGGTALMASSMILAGREMMGQRKEDEDVGYDTGQHVSIL